MLMYAINYNLSYGLDYEERFWSVTSFLWLALGNIIFSHKYSWNIVDFETVTFMECTYSIIWNFVSLMQLLFQAFVKCCGVYKRKWLHEDENDWNKNEKSRIAAKFCRYNIICMILYVFKSRLTSYPWTTHERIGLTQLLKKSVHNCTS